MLGADGKGVEVDAAGVWEGVLGIGALAGAGSGSTSMARSGSHYTVRTVEVPEYCLLAASQPSTSALNPSPARHSLVTTGACSASEFSRPSSTPTRPAHFNIERVIRPNILALHPYRCARDDYSSGILLDANENALGHSISASDDTSTTPQLNRNTPVEIDPILTLDLHRYPDPSHLKIKEHIAELHGLPGPDHVFLGVGLD